MGYSLSDLAKSGLTVSDDIRTLENKTCTSSGMYLKQKPSNSDIADYY